MPAQFADRNGVIGLVDLLGYDGRWRHGRRRCFRFWFRFRFRFRFEVQRLGNFGRVPVYGEISDLGFVDFHPQPKQFDDIGGRIFMQFGGIDQCGWVGGDHYGSTLAEITLVSGDQPGA